MSIDHGERSAASSSWPRLPHWFGVAKNMCNVATSREDVGFSGADVAKIMGQNWPSCFEKSFIGKD
jgi:microsomal dipeptidase-like Zn-dependent dipeptidase